MNRFLSAAIAGMLSLALIGCQSEPQQAADPQTLQADGPADAAERIVDELEANNVLGAIQAALPPADFEAMKLEYEKSRQEVVSEADRAEYALNMAKLTADNAEQALMAEFEPMLVKYETELAAQMPMMLAMGRGYAQQYLQESKTLTDAQKQQAGQLLDSVAKWLDSVNFADRDLARQAIAKVVGTARQLDLKTIDAVQALDFEQAMEKAGVVLGSVKDVLALYGFKINEGLASMRASVVSEEGDAAKVNVEYRLFDQPLQVETDMVRRDGRWYGKDTLAQLDRERSKTQTDVQTDSVSASEEPAAEEVEASVGED